MNFSNAIVNHSDSVNLRLDRKRSEGEVDLGVISMSMDGRDMLRNNIKEVGDMDLVNRMGPIQLPWGTSQLRLKLSEFYHRQEYAVCDQIEISQTILKQC